MVGPSGLSNVQFVDTALEYVAKHGLDGLTMRSLGLAMGTDPTALYRYFPSKEALIDAMLDRILEEALDVAPGRSPRDSLEFLIANCRESFQRHPRVVGAFATTRGSLPHGAEFMNRSIGYLEAIGLRGRSLVIGYQMLEGYILGSSVFDSGDFPKGWATRQLRYRATNRSEFADVAISETSVSSASNDAFTHGLKALLDYCEQVATDQSLG